MSRDCYEVLGLKLFASPLEVKQAFRALAKAHHPDWHPGDTQAAVCFKEITEAYAVLKDPARRAAYDLQLRQAIYVTPPSPPWSWPPPPPSVLVRVIDSIFALPDLVLGIGGGFLLSVLFAWVGTAIHFYVVWLVTGNH